MLPRFKIVTTESSLNSNPGDPATNGKYSEIVKRIENLLSRRSKNDLSEEEKQGVEERGEVYGDYSGVGDNKGALSGLSAPRKILSVTNDPTV